MSKRTFSPTRVVAGAVAVAGILAGTYAWMTRSADDPPAAIMWDSVAPPDAGRHTTGQDLAGVRAALARRRSDVGTDDPGVAELAVRLGDLCRVAGRFDEARSSYAEAAAIRERVAGGGHWQARECRAKIAHLAAVPAGAARGYARRAEAERLLAEGKYSAAHAAAAEALDFTRAARGPDHADAAEALLLLGAISLHHDENYAAAEGLLSEAKAKLAVARGTDHPYFGDCLHLLGVLADARGDFASAEEFYTGAMRVHTAARGEMTAEYARSLSRYGRMCQAWWKEYADGKVYRAQTIREEVLGRAHPDYAESLEDLARFALAAPDVVKADRLLTEALAIRRNAQGPDHPDVAETLSLIGVARDAQGDLAQSQASHRRAVRSAEAARGPRHPLVARYLLNHMTSLAGRMTEFARIDQYGRRALDIWANLALDRHPDTLETRFQIARTRVIEMSKLTKTADYPVADLDANFQELLDGYDRLPGGRDLPGYALAMSERVHMCYYDDFRLHPRAEAEKWLVRAGEVIDRNGGRTHPAYLYYLNAYGRLHLSAGEYDQAGRYFRDCLALVRSRYGSANPWITMYALHSYGGMYLHQGDRDAARRFTREALLVRREMFDRNSHGQSDAERISQVVDMHYTLSGYLSAFVTAGTAADCYDDVLRIRGAAAAQQVEDRAAHDAPDLRGRLEEAQAARRGLAELALSGSDGTPRAAWLDRLGRAAEATSDLEIDLALELQKRLPPPVPLQTRTVQSALPPSFALVDYLEYIQYQSPLDHRGPLRQEKRLAAFVVRPDRGPVFVPLGPSAAIEKAVTGWRAALADHRPSPEVDRAARAVARLVWAPLQTQLGAADTLLVAPDGPVCFLSFAALPGRVPDTYLIEDYTLGYLPSGRAAVALARSAQDGSGRGLLAVGGIAYDRRPGAGGSAARVRGMAVASADWKELPATAAEADGVADRFRTAFHDEPVEVLRGRGAGVGQFARALDRRRRCVHFAGHAFFADPATDIGISGGRRGMAARENGPGNPESYVFGRNQLLLSGLVFSRSDAPGGGVLTAEEMTGFDLRGTDLVVLSACETGLGGSAGGEGVMGLQRAFLGAGAGCLVTSLWKVNDAATSLLMGEFYENLWVKKLSKWEALRQAQLVVLRNPKRVADRDAELSRGLNLGTTLDVPAADDGHRGRTRPHLWAAFVVSGDGR